MMFHHTRIKCEQRPITICGNSLTAKKHKIPRRNN